MKLHPFTHILIPLALLILLVLVQKETKNWNKLEQKNWQNLVLYIMHWNTLIYKYRHSIGTQSKKIWLSNAYTGLLCPLIDNTIEPNLIMSGYCISGGRWGRLQMVFFRFFAIIMFLINLPPWRRFPKPNRQLQFKQFPPNQNLSYNSK